MAGLGTIFNVAGIVLGGLFGMLFGKWIKPRMQETLNSAIGVCVILVGISGALQEMFTIGAEGLESGGTVMTIVSMVLGSLFGEVLNLEDRIEGIGEYLKRKTRSDRDASFVDGFVTGSLTVCVGAMAVVGAIQDGISGDYSILLVKALLDMLIIAVMAAALGKGCLFSAIPVAVLQGSITLLARWLEPLMTEQALSNLSLTGSILIFCVGVNLAFGKKFRAANMLPSIVVAVLWGIFVP